VFLAERGIAENRRGRVRVVLKLRSSISALMTYGALQLYNGFRSSLTSATYLTTKCSHC
jgi:hypothetical protein